MKCEKIANLIWKEDKHLKVQQCRKIIEKQVQEALNDRIIIYTKTLDDLEKIVLEEVKNKLNLENKILDLNHSIYYYDDRSWCYVAELVFILFSFKNLT